MNSNDQSDLLSDVYNLILSPTITDRERQVLLTLKNQLEEDKLTSIDTWLQLQSDLQKIAIKNLSTNERLSPEIEELSKRLATLRYHKEREMNLARGLIGVFGGH